MHFSSCSVSLVQEQRTEKGVLNLLGYDAIFILTGRTINLGVIGGRRLLMLLDWWRRVWIEFVTGGSRQSGLFVL